ncbi:hypothetical protein [Acrocarpospora phusangensis]|uniref:hypothetical protein n=1 Tax=Acrocarpospora phusangensis TaxID=1070424 RepID=UPI00194EF201|nr:hypothetical protein [Acrocarpospora phusangensis]
MSVRVTIEAVRRPGLAAERVRELAQGHPEVRGHLEQVSELIVHDAAALGHDPGEDAPFRAHVFDPVGNRAVEIRGTLDRLGEVEVRPSAVRPRPQPGELAAAAEILRGDPRFPAGDDVVIYQPMPPLADLERPDGSLVRRPTLGVYNPAGGPRHQIVAVDVAAHTVDWHPADVAAHTDDDCEKHLPEGVGSQADRGGPDQVRVRVVRDGVELWNLIVVRPRASQPAPDGAGVELLNVRYRGRLVLRQAHMPVLNVLYADGETNFRDWANEETVFKATGEDPAGWGWRLCSKPPQTILERPEDDRGNFQGVAFHHDGEELRVVSELQAGWYRYVSDWRLADDGTIRPRFGFAGTKDPMTCNRHEHHAYWRLDFDLDGAANDTVQQLEDGGGIVLDSVPIRRETSRRRRGGIKGWQVVDKKTGRGYQIWPGEHDASADAYGVADAWFLRHRATELHDGGHMGRPSDSKTHLNKFLDGENIDGANLVVWYAGHFLHDQAAPEPHQGHIVGPDLIPVPGD